VSVDKKLFFQLVISTVLMSVMIIPAVYMLPDYDMEMKFGGTVYVATNWKLYGCIMMGLWSGMIIGASTEYYTSNSY